MGLGVGRVSLSSACEHLGCGHVPAALRLPSQQGRERREEDGPDGASLSPQSWSRGAGSCPISTMHGLGGMVGEGPTARQPLSS